MESDDSLEDETSGCINNLRRWFHRWRFSTGRRSYLRSQSTPSKRPIMHGPTSHQQIHCSNYYSAQILHGFESQVLKDVHIKRRPSLPHQEEVVSVKFCSNLHIHNENLRPTDTIEPEYQQSLQMQQSKVTDCKGNQFQGPGGNVDVELIEKRYRVHFPTAGRYQWPETGLGFIVRHTVTVMIAFESWSQHLSLALQQDECWMVAGPLFGITAEPEEAIAEIDLPHFICLQGNEVNLSWFRVAHFKDEGVLLEEPTQVESFYTVLENPSFSLMGVLLWIASGTRLSVPITSTTLIYYHPHPEDSKFHLYLIPSDCTLTKAIEEEEGKFHGVRLQNSPPVEPLNFGSRYVVSGCAHLEIIPKELKLSYRSPGEIQPFSKVYAGQIKKPIQLGITDKKLRRLVWETLIKPADLPPGGTSDPPDFSVVPPPGSARRPPDFSGAAFVKEHRKQLRERMGELGGVLDDLHDNGVLTENERALVEQEKTQQKKNRTLLGMVERKGEQALECFYRSLRKRDPYLLTDLSEAHHHD